MHDDPKLRPQLLAREPAFYQQHAQADKRAEARRAEFHRTFQQERRKRARVQKQALKQDGLRDEQQPQQKAASRAGAAAEKKAGSEKAERATSRKDEKRAASKDSRRAKTEKKGYRKDVPPTTAERVRSMQRGDKAAAARGETPR